MMLNSVIDSNGTSERPTFDGAPFKCRLCFCGRGQSANAPTVVTNKTNLHKGDLFVINLNDEGTQKIVIQVDEERNSPSGNPEIYIDESIKKTFSVISFIRNDHTVQKVATKDRFALQLVELQVKEQYLSRGDAWRFTRKLVNTSVYLKKSLEIFFMRATVYGLWVDTYPYRVSSGYVTENTKFVFRSLSACCTIFLQMSKEMWDFDHHGDIYYEKAVDGFLHDLFIRWKSMSCQHDVTMTLFSRVFYDAKSYTDFPENLRQHINKDHRGRFYQDFYRVIYQNERYDDWLPRLSKIKKYLVNYKEELLMYHKKRLPKEEADKVPHATLSCAADGNILETLNLSLSVFERQFIDQAFDRVGQMSIIITPGAGIFEVDRQLTNMTKQRILDNGIGSDLVCLGEQPLFAVPLFKFFKPNLNTADDYQIPHWINLSYYRSSIASTCFHRYIPRVPFNTNRIKHGMLDVKNIMNSITDNTFTKPPHLSMEEYDEQIFRTSIKSNIKKETHSKKISKVERRAPRKRYITVGPRYQQGLEEVEEVLEESNGISINQKNDDLKYLLNDDPQQLNRIIKDDMGLSTSHVGVSTNVLVNFLYSNVSNQSHPLSICSQMNESNIALSAETYFLSTNLFIRLQIPPRPLVNPFAPGSHRMPMAPGRRRWAHTFPLGPNKIPWHFHHLRQNENSQNATMMGIASSINSYVAPGTSKKISNGAVFKRARYEGKHINDGKSRQKRLSNSEKKRDASDRKDSNSDDIRVSFNGNLTKRSASDSFIKSSHLKKKKETIIWGPTGVEPWSASMITGIDWKSLTIPASLPTTCDVSPTPEELQRDYTHNFYTVFLPVPSQQEYERMKKYMHNVNEMNDKGNVDDNLRRQRIVFDEYIDQRLSQGFQIIIEIPTYIEQKMVATIQRAGFLNTGHNRLLNVGRIYHTLSLVKEENQSQDVVVIHVQQYKPCYTFQSTPIPYKYLFQCPDSCSYDPANYDLQAENIEAFPWNTVDIVVGHCGTGNYKISNLTKFWHTRLVLMPVSKDYTIKNIESGLTKCDSRQEMSHEDYFLYVEHFIRFLFMLNKLTRLRTGLTESIHRPLDPKTGKPRIEHFQQQGQHAISIKKFNKAKVLQGDQSAIKDLLSLLRDEQQGLSFVKDAVLPEFTFIAIEAIWWSIEHGEDIENEEKASITFQFLFEQGYIKHSTNSETSFRFGFFLYYIVTEKTTNFCLRANDYAEVEFHATKEYIPSMDYLGFAKCIPMRLLPRLIDDPQSKTRPGRSSSNGIDSVPLSSSDNGEKTSAIVLKRDCNVDVDSKQISDRREWATAHFHSFYNPHCLFELEIRWLVATSCILGELITNWSQRTGTIHGPKHVAFHLVPIPCDPFAESDALRGPIYIELNASCLQEQLSQLSEDIQIIRINIFQELILKRYGFILNACVSYKDQNIYYVHISGGMLVYILSDVYNKHRKRRPTRIVSTGSIGDGHRTSIDYGFYWCWNFCLGKKWRSSQTGEEKYQDIMLADFRAFCSNDRNRLVKFWNEVNDLANEKMLENHLMSSNGD